VVHTSTGLVVSVEPRNKEGTPNDCCGGLTAAAHNRMTRERQELLRRKRPTWATRPLQQRQYLDERPSLGRRPGAVLLRPLVGVRRAALDSALRSFCATTAADSQGPAGFSGSTVRETRYASNGIHTVNLVPCTFRNPHRINGDLGGDPEGTANL
jgi:hypothetical protein